MQIIIYNYMISVAATTLNSCKYKNPWTDDKNEKNIIGK